MPSTSTNPEAHPPVGIPQTLLVQLGLATLAAPQLLAVQQRPGAVDTHVPLAEHAAVPVGQEQVPAGPLQVSPAMPVMRWQSEEAQQVALLMQVLLPGQS